MISLRKSISDMDRLDAMQKAASDCYRAAVETSAHHVVETDKSLTQLFRKEPEGLARRVKDAGTTGELEETRIAFEQYVEQYARQGSLYLLTLKEQVNATRRALSDLIDSLAQGEGDERSRLEAGLSRLEQIASRPEVRQVCPEMEVLVASIEDGVGRMRKKNQLVVAQLQDELHSLQSALDKAQQTARRHDRSGVLNRVKMLGLIRQSLAARKSFCLILISIGNASYLSSTYGGHVFDDVIGDFCQQLTDVAGHATVCGQWNQSVFLLFVEKPKPEAMELGYRLADRLEGPYIPRQSAAGRGVKLRLTTGVFEAELGTTEGRLLAAVERLLAALEDVPA